MIFEKYAASPFYDFEKISIETIFWFENDDDP